MLKQVTLQKNINTSSYALVAQELSNTLQQATNVFETFLAERHDLQLLQHCEADLRQIGGTLRLIEVKGAALIADEMRAMCCAILENTEALPDAQLNALSTAFFVLPRYLEFVQSRGKEIPLLAVTHANELRSAHRQLLLPDSYFVDADHFLFSRDSRLTLRNTPLADADFADLLKRLRQNYQRGLLGLLRDAQPELQLTLMSRSLRRLCGVLPAGPNQRFWLLASAVVEAFKEGGLELNPRRKRLLSALDGALRRLANNKAGDEVLEQELLFLLRLSAWQDGLCGKLLKAIGAEPCEIDDAELQRLRKQMLGLSYDTVSSVLNELRAELRHAKDILELLAQHGRSDDDEIRPLSELLQQGADVLQVLNLSSLADILSRHAKELLGMIGGDLSKARDTLEDLAETLLFIESSLAQIDRRKLNYDELNNLSIDKRDSISADNQVSEATAIVIDEAKSAIAMVKRAIGSYIDSGFDGSHIANVPQSLDSVRGAFQILKMGRLAGVAASAANFVKTFVAREGGDPQREVQSLETLADAMISVEYYLGELESRHLPDGKVLAIAEDSLKQLGFPVEPTQDKGHVAP
ncbi:hypothetical protein [Spongiibacter sp.]|uniref:hypothetical protein n=1 Tax=Spongiibacter sp. TaxID=2024860 RepID=UPI003562AAFA